MSIKLNRTLTPDAAVLKGLNDISGKGFNSDDFSILNSIGLWDKSDTTLEMQIKPHNEKFSGEIKRQYKRVNILDAIESYTQKRAYYYFTNSPLPSGPTTNNIATSLAADYAIKVDALNLEIVEREEKLFCQCNCKAYYGEFEIIVLPARINLSTLVGAQFAIPWGSSFDFKWDENYDGETRFREELARYQEEKNSVVWDLNGVKLQPVYQNPSCYMNFTVPPGHLKYNPQTFKSKYGLVFLSDIASATDPNFNAATGAILVYSKDAVDITSEDYIPLMCALGEQWGFPLDLKYNPDIQILSTKENKIRIRFLEQPWTFKGVDPISVKLVPELEKLNEIFPEDNLDMFENPLEETRK